MKLNIEFKEKSRADTVTILNALLPDEVILSAKTRNCHWQIPGRTANDCGVAVGREKVIRQFRTDVAECGNKIDDAGTADFLTGLVEQHERFKRDQRNSQTLNKEK